MDASPAIEAVVQKSIERLERVHRGITACHVVIDAPQQHHRQGGHFQVHIHLTVPGGEVVASRTPTLADRHEDLFMALGDAFDAARRELIDWKLRLQAPVAKRPS